MMLTFRDIPQRSAANAAPRTIHGAAEHRRTIEGTPVRTTNAAALIGSKRDQYGM